MSVNCNFIKFSQKNALTFAEITNIVTRFPERWKDYVQVPYVLDALEEEFLIYQTMVDADIPSKIWKESKCSKDESKTYHRMDMIWNYLRKELS